MSQVYRYKKVYTKVYSNFDQSLQQRATIIVMYLVPARRALELSINFLPVTAQPYYCKGRDASDDLFFLHNKSAGDESSRVSSWQALVAKLVSLVRQRSVLFAKRFSADSVVT